MGVLGGGIVGVEGSDGQWGMRGYWRVWEVRGSCTYAYLCNNSENVKIYPKNARYDLHAFPDDPKTPYESKSLKYEGINLV